MDNERHLNIYAEKGLHKQFNHECDQSAKSLLFEKYKQYRHLIISLIRMSKKYTI